MTEALALGKFVIRRTGESSIRTEQDELCYLSAMTVVAAFGFKALGVQGESLILDFQRHSSPI